MREPQRRGVKNQRKGWAWDPLWGVRSRVGVLGFPSSNFVREKNKKNFIFLLPHYLLLEKIFLLIRRYPFDLKKWVSINHPEPSSQASTLGKDDLFRASSGSFVDVRYAVRLLDIRKELLPYPSVVVIIDPWSNNGFWTHHIRSKC